MGNSASQLPFSIDNQVGAPHDHNGWALHNGKSTDGKEREVSVFVGKKPQLAKQSVSPRAPPTKTQLVPALHHYDHCRKLRHPHILKVLATLDTDNPTAASTEGMGPSATKESSSKTTAGDLIIVTEPCQSLDQWLLSNPAPEQLAWGLECVVQGLHFLHASAQLAHGNVHPGSLYVTQSGDVKLWNFSLITQVGPNLGPDNHFQEWESAVTPESYRSPERIQKQYAAISQKGGIHSMDSYSLGVLADHWFRGQIPAMLQKAVQRLQTPNMKMRPRLQPLLKCPVFDTPYQKLQKQFEEIQIQPVENKIQLWQNLDVSLQAGLIPKDLALYKVLPLIQAGIQTTCTNESLMGQDLYRQEVLAMVTPMFCIVENYLDPSKVSKALGSLVALLFMVKDRGVRGALLGKVGFMSQHLDKNTLNTSIFEPLCSGFNDSSPALREMTLKATWGLVPFLNAPNLEKLSRYLVRLQSDTETSIRTNAVIFISKIAASLSEVPREKMLLPAYARAMRDTFGPCRLSALKSLAKSRDLFTKADLAGKILPTITPLLLDPMTDVRTETFQVVHELIQILEQESDRMAHLAQREAAKQPSATTPIVVATISTPAKVTPAPTSGRYLSGLSSWMASSAKPDTTPVKSAGAANPATPPQSAPVPPMVAAPAPALVPVQQFASTTLVAPVADDEGWGDEDDGGWGDDDNDTAMENPFASIGIKAKSAALRPAITTPSTNVGANDDPFAAIGMKPATAIAHRHKGKLVLPKKSTGGALKLKAAVPATKMSIDASEMGDGWDDF